MNAPFRIISSATILLLMAGCVSQEDKATEAMDQALDGQFTDYRNLRTYDGGVTCGQYMIIDYRGDVAYRDFIVIDAETISRPTPLDLEVYCSEDPKASLNGAIGIDYDRQKDRIDAIIADFTTLEAPLLGYEEDNGYFPFSNQGLAALVSPATVGNPPKNFPEGGYISAIPSDPWGNDYDYACEPFAGIRVLYELQSLGEDGQPGGSGVNADIKATYLQYFRHIEKLDG